MANSINAESCGSEVILYATPLKSAITFVALVRSKSDDTSKMIARDIKAQMKEKSGSQNLRLWGKGIDYSVCLSTNTGPFPKGHFITLFVSSLPQAYNQ